MGIRGRGKEGVDLSLGGEGRRVSCSKKKARDIFREGKGKKGRSREERGKEEELSHNQPYYMKKGKIFAVD